ncbi:MAG TPA: ABC transporter permease subunit, partial [Paracoccaceae bacterium]|nr:ABC transporter permease subunit [Paracoccaceae bacterium]
LRGVPGEIIEAALMSGATPRQLFWLARVPGARAQLLIGVNQTTMYALSMVIIVALIGGYDDIGWEVLSAMRKADMGRSLLSGAVIVILAVLLDRITYGFARQPRRSAGKSVVVGLFILAGIAWLGLRIAWPAGMPFPDALGRMVSGFINSQLMDAIAAGAGFFEALRQSVTYGMMLPLRVGIGGAASPVIWGFSGGIWLPTLFTGLALALAALAWRRFGWAMSVAVLAAALILWAGLPRFPWPGLIALTALLAWRVAGPSIAVLATATLGVALLGGIWGALMQSLYLVFLAVVISVLIGGLFGAAASVRPRLASTLQPLADTLQTMPQFVFLIPALMIFGVGEFAALIAIILYSVVPPYRYVQHGLTHVPTAPVEAGIQMGATPRQLLWLVKAPLARDSLRLGINQTIMAALSMLVIAALVGTRDLGQQIYVALGKADAGMGLVAGGIIACIGIVADRLIRTAGEEE